MFAIFKSWNEPEHRAINVFQLSTHLFLIPTWQVSRKLHAKYRLFYAIPFSEVNWNQSLQTEIISKWRKLSLICVAAYRLLIIDLDLPFQKQFAKLHSTDFFQPWKHSNSHSLAEFFFRLIVSDFLNSCTFSQLHWKSYQTFTYVSFSHPAVVAEAIPVQPAFSS